MKLIAMLAGMLITGGILFTPTRKSLKGTWLIENIQQECSSKVLRIQMQQGIWKGLIDLPSIGKYDQQVNSIHVEKDSVTIYLNTKEIIAGKLINDSLISASLISGNQKVDVDLIKQ